MPYPLEPIELARAWNARFAASGDLAHLTVASRAIGEMINARRRIAAGPQDTTWRLLRSVAAAIVVTRRNQTRIQKLAVKECEDSLHHISATDPGRARTMKLLAKLLHKRCGEWPCLMLPGEKTLAKNEDDPPDLWAMLGIVSATYLIIYERTSDIETLDKGIQTTQERLTLPPAIDSERAEMLDDLSRFFHYRYARTGDMEDIEQAIRASEEAVVSTASDHPQRAYRLNNWSTALFVRYDASRDLADISKAISASEEAVQLSSDAKLWPITLSTLAERFYARFTLVGNLADLERAVDANRRVLATMDGNDQMRPHLLDCMGIYLMERYERLWALHDLEGGIKMCEEAVAASPPGHHARAGRLNNLATALAERFNRFGALEDLQMAIGAGEEAVATSEPDEPAHWAMVQNWTWGLVQRFKRLESKDDIDMAVRVAGEAVASVNQDHPDRASMLDSWGCHLSTRFIYFGSLEDVTNGINALEEAVASTPAEHPECAIRWSNLASLLSSRFRREGNLTDHTNAIKAGETAILGIERDNPRHAHTLFHQALRLVLRDPFRSGPLLSQSLELALQAWHSEMAGPVVRIGAAHHAIQILASTARWEEAYTLAAEAIRLLPTLTPQHLGRNDLESWLLRLPQLAAEAASIGLQAASTPAQCIRLLELGRGVMIGLAIDRRTDISELQIKYPVIFDRLNLLRIETDSPLNITLHNEIKPAAHHLLYRNDSPWVLVPEQYSYEESTTENRRRRRVQAIKDRDDTLTYIRQLPGFEGFQLPPSPSELTSLAGDGAIVIINTTMVRSDAIIVTRSAIRSLSLPDLKHSEAQSQMELLGQQTRGRRSTYALRNTEMRRVLGWLWDVVVEPVLDELQYKAVADYNLPRVWWIGVGPLARAPFHAAGEHEVPGSTRNTISRAISSYIPTIKALAYARQNKLELLTSPSRLLLVTMPITPDTPPVPEIPSKPGVQAIPGTPFVPATLTSPAILRTAGISATYPSPAVPGTPAKKWAALKNISTEVEEIMAVIQSSSTITPTRLDSPTIAQLTAELPAYHAIHFACHGVTDSKSPSNSHLLLQSRNPVEQGPAKLTVGDISNMNLNRVQVAYLSACSTAQNSSFGLADESIHIASGFQLAGFSHVLATLWEANDEACRVVSVEYYRGLFDGRWNDAGHRAVSTAFHHAVKKLRNANVNQPIKWAPFIHTGA